MLKNKIKIPFSEEFCKEEVDPIADKFNEVSVVDVTAAAIGLIFIDSVDDRAVSCVVLIK